MITVLFAGHNESNNEYFWESIQRLLEFRQNGMDIDVIVGLTPGTDDTLSRLKSLNVPVAIIETTKRAQRYNSAFSLSHSGPRDLILLHHPRSLIEEEGIVALSKLPEDYNWGAYTHAFDDKHPLLTFTSWWSNYVRGDRRKIYYLDHCLFLRREIFERIGGVPDVEIF